MLLPSGRDGSRVPRSMADGDTAQIKGGGDCIHAPARSHSLCRHPQSSIAVSPDEIGSSLSLVTKNENKNYKNFKTGWFCECRLLLPDGRDGTRVRRSMGDGDAAEKRGRYPAPRPPRPHSLCPRPIIYCGLPGRDWRFVSISNKNENKNENLFQNGS